MIVKIQGFRYVHKTGRFDNEVLIKQLKYRYLQWYFTDKSDAYHTAKKTNVSSSITGQFTKIWYNIIRVTQNSGSVPLFLETSDPNRLKKIKEAFLNKVSFNP